MKPPISACQQLWRGFLFLKNAAVSGSRRMKECGEPSSYVSKCFLRNGALEGRKSAMNQSSVLHDMSEIQLPTEMQLYTSEQYQLYLKPWLKARCNFWPLTVSSWILTLEGQSACLMIACTSELNKEN